MIEAIAPFYTVVIFLKEVAIFAFFVIMVWAVIKTVRDEKKNKKAE